MRHIGDDVHIDLVVRATEIGADEFVAGLPSPLIIPRETYASEIRAFAIAVRDGLIRDVQVFFGGEAPGAGKD